MPSDMCSTPSPTTNPLPELSLLSGPTVVNACSPSIDPHSRPQSEALDSDFSNSDCPGCSACIGSNASDCESSSDSEDYDYDSDTPLCETAGRIRGGALRRSRRLAKKKKKKPCPRSGNAHPSRSHNIRSGVIEGSEGPFVPEGTVIPEERDGHDNSHGTHEAKGAQGNGTRRKRKRGGKPGPRTKPKDDMAIQWEMVLREATTPYATPLLARLCIMSGRSERDSLRRLVDDLEAGPLQLYSRPASETHWLNRIVDSIDLTTSVAKVNELCKIFSLMNLALELDR